MLGIVVIVFGGGSLGKCRFVPVVGIVGSILEGS